MAQSPSLTVDRVPLFTKVKVVLGKFTLVMVNSPFWSPKNPLRHQIAFVRHLSSSLEENKSCILSEASLLVASLDRYMFAFCFIPGRGVEELAGNKNKDNKFLYFSFLFLKYILQLLQDYIFWIFKNFLNTQKI